MVAEGYWTWRDPRRRCPACRTSRQQLPRLAGRRGGDDGAAAPLPARPRAAGPGGTRRCTRSTCGRTAPRSSPTPSSSACPRRRCGAALAMGRWSRSRLAVAPVCRRGDRQPVVTSRATAPSLRRRRRVALTAHTVVNARAAAPPVAGADGRRDRVAVLLPRARRGRPGRPVPASRCWPSAASPTWRSWSSTTAPPTAPPTSCAAAAGDRVRAAHRRRRCRPAGSASRTPASSSPTRPTRRRRPGLRRRRRGARPRRRRRRPSTCCVGRGRRCSRRTRGSSRARASGWCSRCCSGRG